MIRNKFGKDLSPEHERVYWAAADGDFNTLLRALQSGFPINFINPVTTDSPLMVACRKGHAQIVRLCLDYGAKNDPHPEFGQTALHAAVTANQFECAKVLLDIAAASDADHIISNLTDQHSQTPLHSAVLIGSVEITELLLQHGAKISAVDSYGQTPLHICSGSSSEACLAMLLDHGGDDYLESLDVYGNTPLHHAAYNGNLNCAKLLLETAANASARNAKGLTAYNLATMQGHHQIGLILLEYKDLQPTLSSLTSYPPRPMSNRLSAFSPTDSFSTVSTPSASRVGDDLEFRTPAGGYSEKKGLKIRSFSMESITMGGNNGDSLGNNLPRPHTVGSPSVNLKNGQTRRLSSSVSSSNSPVDPIRKYSDGDRAVIAAQQKLPMSARLSSDDSIQSQILGHRMESMHSNEDESLSTKSLTQLSTPLLSRESSNQYGLGGSPRDAIRNNLLATNGATPTVNRYGNNNGSNVNTNNNNSNNWSRNNGPTPLKFNALARDTSTDYSYMTAKNRGVLEGPMMNNYFQSDSRESNNNIPNVGNSLTTFSNDNEEVRDEVREQPTAVISTPHRRETNTSTPSQPYYVSTETGESEFADPLEVFEALGRTWYVYMTEEEHIYYLDMVNSHSQWEDPREYGLVNMENYQDLPPESPSRLSDGIAPPLSPAFRSPSVSKYSPKSDMKEEESPRNLKPLPKELKMNPIQEEGDEKIVSASIDITASLITTTNVEMETSSTRPSRTTEVTTTPRLKSDDMLEVLNSPTNSTSSDEGEYSLDKELEIRNAIKHRNQSKPSEPGSKTEKPSESLSRPSSKSNVFTFDEQAIQQSLSSPKTRPLHHKQQQQKFRSIRSFELRKTTSADSPVKNPQSESGNNSMKNLDPIRNSYDSSTHHPAIQQPAGDVKKLRDNVSYNPQELLTKTSHDDSNLKQFFHKRKILHDEEQEATANTMLPFPFPKRNLNELLEKASPNKENTKKHVNSHVSPQKQEGEETSQAHPNQEEDFEAIEEEDDSNDREHYIQLIVRKKNTPQEIRLLLEAHGKSNQYILDLLSAADEAILASADPEGEDTDKDNTPDKRSSNTQPVETEETRQTKIHESLQQLLAVPVNKPIYEKYCKMYKLGVQPVNIIQKMKMEGMDTHYISTMEQCLLLSNTPNTSNNGKTEKVTSKELLLTKDWNAVTNHDRLKNSIWAFSALTSFASDGSRNDLIDTYTNATSSDANNGTGLLAEKELQELEALFFQQQHPSASGNTAYTGDTTTAEDHMTEKRKKVLTALQKTSEKPIKLRILECKRAQNIIIGLVPFKSMGNQLDIIKAICALDTLQDQLTLDHLENFSYLLPTESELKLSYQLKDRASSTDEIQHPAEVFLQAMILFYPELPIRLSIFQHCLALPIRLESLSQRMKVMMNLINQILSSPKLAKLLQKLLMIGRVMINENTGNSSISKARLPPNRTTMNNHAKLTVLEQLVLISNTKGIDKKTSVMDYVVKSLFDKNEQDLLRVFEDLSLITQSLYQQEGSSSSSHGGGGNGPSISNSHQLSSSHASTSIPHQFHSVEIFQEYHALQQQFQQLTQEYERNTHLASSQTIPTASTASDVFASPTAKRISSEYLTNLENYIYEFREQMNSIMKKKLLLTKKLQQLIDYFGEERNHYLVTLPQPATTATTTANSKTVRNTTATTPPQVYDVSSIFLALKDFSKSLAFSKEQYEWKLSRK